MTGVIYPKSPSTPSSDQPNRSIVPPVMPASARSNTANPDVAGSASPPKTLAFAPAVIYRVAMPEPTSHLFEVTLTVDMGAASSLCLHLPVWTPGSYLVREYGRHLQDFEVLQREPLVSWSKISKNQWQLVVQAEEPGTQGTDRSNETPETPASRTPLPQAASASTPVTVRYRVFANDLTVRTNHLDATHGYFNPAALLLYVPQWRDRPHQISLDRPHAHWHIATPLAPSSTDPYTFLAPDYDTLVDSPFEVGEQRVIPFEALGKDHEWVIWGSGPVDTQRLVADTQKIIETEAAIFGGVPYDRYLFLLHLSASGFGGLEHKNSCSLNYPRLGLRSRESYGRFLRLVAHEFFHLWNVKRIRPKALEIFDYDQENYTPSLWFCEGVTSYYDRVIPHRAGLATAAEFLDLMSQDITRLQTTPGRRVQPLSESSFDAWIKLYRREAHSNNNQISYYLKGELVAFLLDLMIRAQHRNQRCLDQVLQRLWQEFGQPEVGYTEAQLHAIIGAVAEVDVEDFLHLALQTTEELPFDSVLADFGLKLEVKTASVPFLGLTIAENRGQTLVQFVYQDSPAQRVGLEPGDEILALDGFRVGLKLEEQLRYYAPGDTITLTVFHQDALQTHSIRLDPPQPVSYTLVPIADASPEQLALRQGWLGEDLPA
ncbi:MAG: M61 family metallopeptidase [Prochlorothrix sp.]